MKAKRNPSLSKPSPSEPPVSSRGGCKVGWETYRLRADAELMARYHAEVAASMAEQGYDFGYCTPGSIVAVKDGFEVCTP